MRITHDAGCPFGRGTLALLLVLLLSAPLTACQTRDTRALPPEVATQEKPAPSPSGNYRLVVKEQATPDGAAPDLYFQIQSQAGELLYESEDSFSDFHTTYFLWDDEDRVWVYSGDVGTFIWEQAQEERTWLKTSYAESDLPAPTFLKEVRPEQFPR